MIDLARFNKLKEQAEKAKQAADQATGAMQQTLKEIQEKFNCHTIEEARTLLKQLETSETELELEYNNELEKFEETWGKNFNGLS